MRDSVKSSKFCRRKISPLGPARASPSADGAPALAFESLTIAQLFPIKCYALSWTSAEGERFELSVGFPTHAFQACALDHYANPPSSAVYAIPNRLNNYRRYVDISIQCGDDSCIKNQGATKDLEAHQTKPYNCGTTKERCAPRMLTDPHRDPHAREATRDHRDAHARRVHLPC